MSMGQILAKEIGPAMLARGHSYYVLLCEPEITHSALASLLPDRHPFPQKRRIYIFPPGQNLPPQRRLPLGAHIVPFNKALFESPAVASSQPFMKWLQDTWQEPNLLLQYGFGICLLARDVLAAWCMAENITNSSCEAGIETHPSFRRQSFAYLAARAFLAQCQERELNVYWVCRESNRASSALAEKLGFGGLHNFIAWFGSFDAQEEQRILKRHNME